MKHIIFYIVVSILFVSVFSCKQRKNMQYLPFFYMKNYEVMHSKKYISIRENEYSDIDDTGFVKEYGKSMIFMTTKREIDTTFLIGGRQKRVVSAKLNDSLFVSALHNIAIYETVDLELVYDIKYNIKQIRCQTLWVDYLQKGSKRINYKPLYLQKPYKRNNVSCKE